ncbi:MAG: hypothetical protein KGJ23_07765 [Euryarchaeota archaeon]|nr:hypothetical protein [Euryarchaeota archaeon]MDE1836496.1 hypothetical protein [Euryarchaeota archaeon]MDE1880239.1 hypothetical protein [Euryarchaeota archaeon]MDE2044466.1 hypothetical protein [Thermoplasmata archaeon]
MCERKQDGTYAKCPLDFIHMAQLLADPSDRPTMRGNLADNLDTFGAVLTRYPELSKKRKE